LLDLTRNEALGRDLFSQSVSNALPAASICNACGQCLPARNRLRESLPKSRPLCRGLDQTRASSSLSTITVSGFAPCGRKKEAVICEEWPLVVSLSDVDASLLIDGHAQAFRKARESRSCTARIAYCLRGFTNLTIESRSPHSPKRCAICVTKVIWNSKQNSRLRRSGARSPAYYIEMTNKYARHQFGVLTQQTKELAVLAQN
jgi:hypothetical protein